jgi:hypothetical protein
VSHPFAPKFGGGSPEHPEGVCAFCGVPKLEGDHRDLTSEERDEARKTMDKLIDIVTGSV